MLGQERSHVRESIQHTLLQVPATQREGAPRAIPLKEFVHVNETAGMKYISAGRNGEFIPFELYDLTHPGEMWQQLRGQIKPTNEWDIGVSGASFFKQLLLGELLLILLVSIMFVCFLLAAQFESFVQPLIVLPEIPVAIAAALGLLMLFGYSLILMWAIGIT